MNESYLAHYGVLGMKWGVRRYRNEDGTLTEAGKKRYAANDAVRKAEIERYSRMEAHERKDFEKQTRVAKELYKQGPNGKMMDDMYGKTSDTYSRFGRTRDDLFKEEVEYQNHAANISASRMEAFANAQKALADMDVATCKKRDIYKKGKQVVVNTYNLQDDEDKRYY